MSDREELARIIRAANDSVLLGDQKWDETLAAAIIEKGWHGPTFAQQLTQDEDQILTIRIPRSSWTGIVIGIEKWAGRPREDIEILSDFEVVAIDGHRA